MASTTTLTPLTQIAWAQDKPSLRIPTTGGRSPDHVDLANAVATLRRTQQNAGPISRSRQWLGANTTTDCVVMGKPPASNRDKTRHDSFNRCFEPTPIRLCVMILTIDYHTDGYFCPVCPSGHKFTTIHFYCIKHK
ncbi:hypothetical protein SARC_01426 [Sphaeroforma arctica JP610]|uniref:Uncharacterized protein n=1 Tax=Sphaeroforma arctica JP610 TaxID=667725 RepID=A0A0L0GBP3_9EUKA|nr:hypothetical protein SARC_01426 [Sphaeroforma arctica JP610]KNC86420.1 hypothetical protein SARC_01426 [Sphaeroforma arctica JP610]|eukprot:XP_014160322.1 hypothetical protein SARC_01426 [Sphaeroforma arctica JP610]